MIDINITKTLNFASVIKTLKDIKKVEGIVVHCRPEFFNYTEDSASTYGAYDLAVNHKFCSESGYHYVIDENDIVECIPANKQTDHLGTGKNTYINRALYGNKAIESTIAVVIAIKKIDEYPDVERKVIKFISDLLIRYKLTPDSVMRGFDLNKTASPLHLVDRIAWRRFIGVLEDTYDAMQPDAEEEYDDSDLEKSIPSYTDNKVREFYLENGEDWEKFIKNYEPDHRDIEEILNFKSNDPDDIKTFLSENKTSFTYTVVENAPNSTEHCSRAFDTITGIATPNTLDVEPIYPDLIVPPGGTITLVSTLSESATTQSNNVPLSVEQFENREKAFNIKNYTDAKKRVAGKPINNNDPFPVDDKIKELESHIPKVKIDEVGFTFHDCNHPDSIIGPAVARNLAMIQDEIITMAKRTEKRLVKLENNLSTVMRNLFRVASRVEINCVYYGGQSVYGKYKCIRCMHNDRINDGQIMTLDQCLSCTKYEPILGQVYAILDDTGANVAQVLDDIQMSYSSMDEYINLTRNEELHKERDFATLTTESTKPKSFEEIHDKGFKMDWNDTGLELQRPNVAEYEIEGIEAVRHSNVKTNEANIEPEFKSTVSDTEAYETIKYNSEDYTFDGFGSQDGPNGSISLTGGVGSEIRNKIVEYAQNALKLCLDGKGRYTMNLDSSVGGTRYSHGDKAVNGIHYWDCSSLVEAAYKSAGINTVAGNTTSEYPTCLPAAGGIIFSHKEEDKALPGDIVWFTNQSPKPSTPAEMASANIYQIGHVAIYIGNGEYIHAASDTFAPTRQIQKLKLTDWTDTVFAIGRPKELIEADKKAAELSASGEGFLNYEAHGFSEKITKVANQYASGDVDRVISSLSQYGYANALKTIAKKHGYDPYLILGLIATESGGDPTNRTGQYWGLMQTNKSVTRATSSLSDIEADLETGCAHLTKMGSYLSGNRGKNLVLVVYAYNAGNGTVDTACNNYGKDADTVMGGAIADYVGRAAAATFGDYKLDECPPYLAKIIVRANMLKAKRALG